MLRPRGFEGLPPAVVLPVFLLLLGSLPRPVFGQDPSDMVREFAETASGFTLVGEIETGALPEQRQITFPVAMVTGSDYMVVGFCDSDCTDLDLAILDREGAELESDYLPDAQPILLLTPEETGAYQIRLDMVTCGVEPCAYAVGIFQGDMREADFGLPGGTLDDRFRAFREELIADGFAEVGAGEQGNLEENQEMRFPFALQGGIDYRIIGVCDNDCENLDLVLFDPDGDEVDSDLLEDAYPIVDVTPPDSAEYRIAVTMVTCTIEPCAFRVAVFGKGPGMAPGGVTVTGEILSESTHRGTLAEGDEQFREGEYFDEYTVRAEAGQRIIADLRSSDFDTYLILEAPNGESERNDDFGDDTHHSHIEWVAEEDGEYSILVTSFSAEVTGDYVLQVVVAEGS